MKKEKILVTGAGGQLGSELIQGLWAHYGKDNVVASDIKEPEGILRTGNFEILDVLKTTKLSEVFKKCSFTQVYHLAAMLSAAGEKNPKSAWRLNMESVINILDTAVACQVEKVY